MGLAPVSKAVGYFIDTERMELLHYGHKLVKFMQISHVHTKLKMIVSFHCNRVALSPGPPMASKHWGQGYKLSRFICIMQISMNVSATLMAVITTASILLGPTHAAVDRDTVWKPTDAHVKVWYISLTE